MDRDPREPQSPDDTHREPRKVYEQPRIVSEEIFETLALACGKASGFFNCQISNRS